MHVGHGHIARHAAKNAVGASLYVFVIVMVMNALTASRANTPDMPLDIFVVLMLFSVSAGVMAALVFGKPVMWYMDGRHKEAVLLLGWTIGFMAAITAIAALVLRQ